MNRFILVNIVFSSFLYIFMISSIVVFLFAYKCIDNGLIVFSTVDIVIYTFNIVCYVSIDKYGIIFNIISNMFYFILWINMTLVYHSNECSQLTKLLDVHFFILVTLTMIYCMIYACVLQFQNCIQNRVDKFIYNYI